MYIWLTTLPILLTNLYKIMKKIIFYSLLMVFLSCSKDEIPTDLTQSTENFTIEETIENKSNRAILATDTFLKPSGGNTGLWFKGGTNVVLDSQGKVITGSLRTYKLLRPLGATSSVWFMGGKPTTFQNGQVKIGTLRLNSLLRYFGSGSGIWFKKWTVVIFQSGKVKTGTLERKTLLRPAGASRSIWYNAGTVVTFNSNGEVL